MAAKPTSELIEGRYEVGALLGRGATGEVWSGRDTRLEREVAIKRLRPDLADDGVRARFAGEARAAARLNHPSIVAVYDSGEWDGAPYLVMECLPGRTLADELVDGPLPGERAREIALDVAGALDAAHGMGVIHRDVKPGNILFTPEGKAKLADFGIAKSTESMDHTQTGMVVGTPAYLAPERLDGDPATPQSDLYSLGVVLYEAVTGECPFRGDTPVALARAVQATTPIPLRDRLPGTDPRVATAVDAAMAKDPADRPSSAAAMVAMLESDVATSRPETADVAETAEFQAPAATTVLPVGAPDDADLRDDTPGTGAWSLPPIRSWWERSTGVQRRGVAAAVLVVAFALLFLIGGGGGGDDDPNPPPTTVAPAATTPLPAPLEDAITRLEESVQP